MEKPVSCVGCPLYSCGKGYVPGDGPKTARMLVIGEAPGGEEIKVDRPFVGPSGEMLNNGLGGGRPLVRVENIRRCLPPEGESEATRRASIAHCTRVHLVPELEKLPEVRSVLLVGADALQWGIGLHAYTWKNEHGTAIHEPGIMQYTGSMFERAEADAILANPEIDGCRMVPWPAKTHTITVTVHPAFALRGQPRFKVEILTNIRRAWNAANMPSPPPRASRYTINFTYQPSDLANIPEEFITDVETLEPSNRIDVACVTEGPYKVHVFDWTPGFKNAMEALLISPGKTKVGHNFSFDIQAFMDDGISPVGPFRDTIVAAARIWPPMPQKRLAEIAAKDKIPVKWLSLDRVVLRCLPWWAYWKRPETRATRAFYRAAFPEIHPGNYKKLYNGLDGLGNHQAWIILKSLFAPAEFERFVKIDMDCAFMPMINMERRGLNVDLNRLDLLRQECEVTKLAAESEIKTLAQGYHNRRRAIVEEALNGLQLGQVLKASVLPRCARHTTYYGQTKRVKDACCAAIRTENATALADLKETEARVRLGKTKLKQIGEAFDPAKPDHWRWILFDKDGLNADRPRDKQIKPVAWTGKKRVPQIDDKAMELLQRKHPDVRLFTLKVEATYATWRLNNTLALVEDADGNPTGKLGEDGRAHTRFSIHRTSTGRYASGTDKEDAEKVRYAAAGNQMNIPNADRSIYIAPSGMLLIAPDYSQIEARVTARRAKETRMLDMWLRGEDIHTNNAVILAEAIGVKLRPEDARVLPFPYDPQKKSYRDVAKIQTHAMDYGEGPGKMSKLTGMPLEVCQRIHAGYFEAYPGLARRMVDVEAEAVERGWLWNAFGLKLGPYAREKRDGKWCLVDREEALAAQPQSDVADMMKVVSRPLDRLELEGYIQRPTLRTTMHDNFWVYAYDGHVKEAAHRIKVIMERSWPELGRLEGYGTFFCPVEVAIGQNGGDKHLHDAKCQARGCDATENPYGLEKVKL